jgi:peptidoglycan/xylan/chitin deacetylase (PgdA/CDA1 family)
MGKQLVTLTFDGSWLSQFENALPLLEDYKLMGTFYIITNRMKAVGPLYIKSVQVQIISGLGHEIGSKSVSCPTLPYHLWRDKNKEVRFSKEILENLTKKQILSFAYPQEKLNNNLIRLLSDSGYKNARTTGESYFNGNFPGFNSKATSPFKLGCKSIKKDTTIKKVEEWITTARRYDFWLVLNFEQVVKNPYNLGCTPEFFQEVCELLNKSDVQVKTISDAFEAFSVVKE